MSLSAGVAALATRIAVEFNSIRTALSGKAATSHVHAATDVSSGTLDVARVPTGSTGSTVALGNHTHSYQASSADLTAIAGLGVTNDSVIQGKGGVWSKRTPAQLKADLALAPADLAAGGTKDATTFLRGDDTWATAGPSGLTIARPGDDLNAKIAALTPGQTLVITGRHVVTDALVAVSGTATLPISIVGDGTAVIEHTGGRTGTGYALTVTGAYLHFADFTAQEAAKAIVLQGSTAHDITFERVVGRRVKNEAWKFRQGANLIHLWDCHAEDTGLGLSFGEGFYVGEAASNWTPTPNVTPDTTSYIRFERCSTRRTRNDGFDFKEGSHHLVAKDCLVERPSATIADSQGDSGYYNRGDTVQFINCHVRNAPGDGFKPYDVVVNSITYGRGVEIWGGLVEGAGGAGVASQSDDLKVYSNFAIAGTVVGGRTNVVGGGWTSAYDPATFAEMTWTSPALFWRVELQPHAASHGTGGQDQLTPAMIGAASTADVAGKLDVLGPVATKTASYTLVDTDAVVVFNTTTGAMTATLPTAVGRAGRRFVIKKLGGSTANPLTIDPAGSETIDGALTEPISVAGGFREIISDGANWQIIGGKVEPVIVQLAGITTAGANINIDASVGSIYRVTASASATTCNLTVPTNPIDGDTITVELLASVATTITVNASILPAGGASPVVVVPIGKRWFGVLRYVTGVGWFLVGSAAQA